MFTSGHILHISLNLDNEEKWLKSWQTFCANQTDKHGLWSSFFIPVLIRSGLLGPHQKRFGNLIRLWLGGVFDLKNVRFWQSSMEPAGLMDSNHLKNKYL